ncbi:MAG TPA: hypothetical protein VHZ55_02755 [Bryobacteraceae bacterium]|nr:hypothetical protein [Bryobacteraceae bacterium]
MSRTTREFDINISLGATRTKRTWNSLYNLGNPVSCAFTFALPMVRPPPNDWRWNPTTWITCSQSPAYSVLE